MKTPYCTPEPMKLTDHHSILTIKEANQIAVTMLTGEYNSHWNPRPCCYKISPRISAAVCRGPKLCSEYGAGIHPENPKTMAFDTHPNQFGRNQYNLISLILTNWTFLSCDTYTVPPLKRIHFTKRGTSAHTLVASILLSYTHKLKILVPKLS